MWAAWLSGVGHAPSKPPPLPPFFPWLLPSCLPALQPASPPFGPSHLHCLQHTQPLDQSQVLKGQHTFCLGWGVGSPAAAASTGAAGLPVCRSKPAHATGPNLPRRHTPRLAPQLKIQLNTDNNIVHGSVRVMGVGTGMEMGMRKGMEMGMGNG